ncbi:MAG: DUF962 domain-containing protein [Oligoflexus sp.]
MKTMVEQLSQYAAYHRDRRNILTHFIGIPMILFSVIILLSRPIFLHVGTIPLNPALIAAVLTSIYYLKLDRGFGLVMAFILALMVNFAYPIAQSTTSIWLSWGISLFVVGWIIQSIGHVWEGRKPAFLDDVVGLIIGPLFVTVEAVCALGLRRDLMKEIEKRAGPQRTGQSKAQTSKKAS